MDLRWERSISIFNITFNEVEKIFKDFLPSLIVKEYKLVTIGGMNSNYIVSTNKDNYFLRITPKASKGYKNELRSYLILKDIVNVPAPLYFRTYNNYNIIIYEYINGVSLQGVSFTDKIIKQVAEDIAKIHNVSKDVYSKFELFEYPPFEIWYDLFLDNERTRKRLGDDIVNRIKKLIISKNKELKIIDSYKGYTHSDFRPSNMMITKEGNIFYIDWEFGNYGHILGDIGQFFRFDEDFSKDKINIFAEKYNETSKFNLPENWYELSKLRDLVNPLQMLGSEAEAPIKYRDLKNIVMKTLNLFGF